MKDTTRKPPYLLTHAMEAHYCDCIIEGGLLTNAMEAHYCDCIVEGGLLSHAMEAIIAQVR